MFWYDSPRHMNKALLSSKSLESVLIGENNPYICIYILYVVFGCCAHPTGLAGWKIRLECGSGASNRQQHWSSCWKGLLFFPCPDAVC